VDIDPRTDKSIWGVLDGVKPEKRAEQSVWWLNGHELIL
jgi:hypothetical protein